jgi:hypothetical protein
LHSDDDHDHDHDDDDDDHDHDHDDDDDHIPLRPAVTVRPGDAPHARTATACRDATGRIRGPIGTSRVHVFQARRSASANKVRADVLQHDLTHRFLLAGGDAATAVSLAVAGRGRRSGLLSPPELLVCLPPALHSSSTRAGGASAEQPLSTRRRGWTCTGLTQWSARGEPGVVAAEQLRNGELRRCWTFARVALLLLLLLRLLLLPLLLRQQQHLPPCCCPCCAARSCLHCGL